MAEANEILTGPSGRGVLFGLARSGGCSCNPSPWSPSSRRQHDALDPICWKVFEGKISGKLATDDRPDLLSALSVSATATC
ncbi:hypothetical protein [Nonomuraea roseola]|uniref:Uncharacterized protein n=1 Tax=Nonomuraea roseola TaxID=46179 RepID=A0ABV5QFV1_9ACTN